jgi:tetratricopeptide (TPR) repeat protein
LRADYHDTEPLIEMAEELCKPLQLDEEGLKGQKDEVKLEFEEQLRMFHFHRGALAHHTNQPKMALANCEAHYRMLRDKLDNTVDQRLGVALNELGVAYLQNNDTTRAEECLRASLDILEQLGDITTNSVSMPLINLGFALWLQGRQDDAATVFERALAARELAYGPNDTKYVKTMGKRVATSTWVPRGVLPPGLQSFGYVCDMLTILSTAFRSFA